MDVIWKKGEVSNAEILSELTGSHDWSRDSVKTYLKRLIEKGLVGVNQLSQRKHRYYPLVKKDAFLAYETSRYLENNYDGLSYMVAGLLQNEKVSDEEIERLEQLIKGYREKQR